MDLKSPCIAEVTSSVLYEFLPEEVESVEKDGTTLLIWNFEIASTDVIGVCPQPPTQENLQVAPLLELESIDCNCSHFLCTANILLIDDEGNTSAHSSDENEDADLLNQGIGQGQNNVSNVINNNEREEEINSDAEQDDNENDDDDEIENDDDENETDDDDEDETEITHTLPFKCIGAAHEMQRQAHLERAHNVLHEDGGQVLVTLRKEPWNERDANAIAIDMNYGHGCIDVGYIASELTKYIHPLLDNDKITDVSVQHIVFRVYFWKIGFYPKILVTRKGPWDQYVIRKSRSVHKGLNLIKSHKIVCMK